MSFRPKINPDTRRTVTKKEEEHVKRKKLREVLCGITVISLMGIFGCVAGAKILNTGFLASYDNLAPIEKAGGLPDFYHVRQGLDLSNYKKIMILDFSTITTNNSLLSATTMREFKTIRKDLADFISQALDGQIFEQSERASTKIKHNDIAKIKKIQADAVLMGNIVELRMDMTTAILAEGKGLIKTQVEIKLVDTKTGEEIVRIIDRNGSDSDKVAAPIVRHLVNLLNKYNN